MRALVLENEFTLDTRLAGWGPGVRIRWQPNADFTAEVTGSGLKMTDDNTRLNVRASLSHRLLAGANEVRLVAVSELFAYQEERELYFSPSGFWRHDIGLEWRGQLGRPRFFGDRERWVSATYLFGVDDRRERYHTVRAGADYELTSGVSATFETLLVRSRAYDATRGTLGVRLKHVPSPAR